MTVITWFILPIVCAIAVAIYLYKKVKAVVSYFAVNWSPKRQRITTAIAALILIVPAVRIYGIWFIILLHFTAFLLITDGIVFIIKKIRRNKEYSKLCEKIYCSGFDCDCNRLWQI